VGLLNACRRVAEISVSLAQEDPKDDEARMGVGKLRAANARRMEWCGEGIQLGRYTGYSSRLCGVST
jgi:hypothetical protein